MKNSFGYIYKTTNLKNGRIYIGQKSGKFQPSYLGSGLIISRAVNRYGRDCFKVEILTHAEDRDKLNKLEIKFIAEYRKLFSGKLYNIMKGGQGGDTSQSHKINCSCWCCRERRGELLSPEERNNVNHKGQWSKENNPQNRPEIRLLNSLAHIGNKNGRFGKHYPHSDKTRQLIRTRIKEWWKERKLEANVSLSNIGNRKG